MFVFSIHNHSGNRAVAQAISPILILRRKSLKTLLDALRIVPVNLG
jgi:hypothetical protein